MILANLSGRRFSRSMIKTTMQKREQALRLLKTGALVAGSIAATNCWAVSVVNQITLLDAESGRELRASKIKYGQKILVRVARDVAGATSMTACRIVLTDSAGNEMMNLLDRTSCKPGVYTSGPMPFLYEFGQTYRVKSTFNYVYNDIFLIVPHPRKKPSSNSVEFALPALGGTATVAQDGRRVTATASLSPAGAALQVFEGPKLLASTTSDADGKAEVTTAELAAGNHALTFKAVAGEYAETLLEQPFQIYVPPPRLELNWAFPKKDAALVDRVISLRGETIVENASLAADALEFWLKPPGDAWIEHHHRPFACPVNTHENTFACQTALSDEAWNKPFVDIKLHLETSASTPIKTNEARRFLIRRPASELLKIAPLQIVVPGDAAASGKRHRPGSAIHYRLVFTALHDLGAFDVNFPLAKH
ncbi:MAG: Ig-like domain-containing protein, partial [Janthinobacterium lividum]